MAGESGEYKKIFSRISKIIGNSKVKQGKSPKQVLVSPKTADDVSSIVKFAESEELGVYPAREKNWVKVDSQTPAVILMDTKDINDILEIDEKNLAVTVGSGVIWKDLLRELSKKKYTLGVYPDSPNLTVGDWIDWGGAGIGSYRHGFASDQIRTLEIVLPDGKIINTGFTKVLPNSSGYNLNGIFVGADSTLGIITKATLKILPKPQGILPMYYVLESPESMTKALVGLTKQKVTPLNVSFFGKNHHKMIRMVEDNLPDLDGYMVNVTLAGLKPVLVQEEELVDQFMERHNARKLESHKAKSLWDARLKYMGSVGKKTKALHAEIAVPLHNLDPLVHDTLAIFSEAKGEGAIKGFVSDRSSVSFTPYLMVDAKASGISKAHRLFLKRIEELSLKYHGRPVGSALYLVSGIRRIYGEGANTILDIKSAIDPHDIMNPQVMK